MVEVCEGGEWGAPGLFVCFHHFAMFVINLVASPAVEIPPRAMF